MFRANDAILRLVLECTRHICELGSLFIVIVGGADLGSSDLQAVLPFVLGCILGWV